MPALALSHGDATVAANDAGGQAVWDRQRAQLLAVLWAAGAPLNLSIADSPLDGASIAVDRPAVLLVRLLPGRDGVHGLGSLVVTAVDPSNDQGGGVLTVTVALAGGVGGAAACETPPCACGAGRGAGTSPGTGTMAVRVPLPSGWAAGNSSTVTCTVHPAQKLI
eukprot:g6802.t1